MFRRGGSGNGGTNGSGPGGANGVQAARQLLLSLFDGALAGQGHGPRAAKTGGRSGGRQGLGSRQREGEWRCHCGFDTNRPSRDACFRCGRARNVAEVGSKGGAQRWGGEGPGQKGKPAGSHGGGGWGYSGPVGAGGSRPLLGGRGLATQGSSGPKGAERDLLQAPAWSGKGPDNAAVLGKTADGKGAKGDHGARGTGTTTTHDLPQGPATEGRHGQSIGKATWGKPRAVVDEEGYELVQPRRVRVEGGANAHDVQAPGQATSNLGGAPSAVPTRRRWSDDDSDDGGDDGDAHYLDGEDDGGEAEGDRGHDPQQLRATFEEHVRAVKSMERAGGFGPALDTMRHARDEAERRWRETKTPAPISKRLGWAEAKLQKAQSALTRARLQLEQFDEETDRRRAEYCDRITEAEQWYRWRQTQLNDIHNEAARGATAGGASSVAGDGSTEVRQRLRVQVLPEVQAILEKVREDDSLHERLSQVFANLVDAETRLGAGKDEGDCDAARFNMCEGDTGDEDWDEDDAMQTERREEEDEDHCHEGTGKGHHQGRTTEWKPEGPGRWTRTANLGREGAQRTSATTGEAAAQAASGAATTRAADERTATAESTAGTRSGGDGTQGGGDHESTEPPRAGKHRRRQTDAEREEEERKASDARRAQELHAQLESASAAQHQSYHEGAGGFGSEAALSCAAQRFVLEVQRAQAQANEMGVEPRSSDGRSLLELSPMELKQWVAVHLEQQQMAD